MIQLTQCPAWPQSLSGGENMCICQKQHSICHTASKVLVPAPADLAQGFSGTPCPPFGEVALAATRLHLDFSALGVQHTWQFTSANSQGIPQGNWGNPTGTQWVILNELHLLTSWLVQERS